MRAGPGPERVSRVTRAEPSEGTVMRPILEMAVEEKQHKTDRWRAAEESRDGRPKGRGPAGRRYTLGLFFLRARTGQTRNIREW